MADGPSPERRQSPRTVVSWSVVVEANGEVFGLETVNLGLLGAKVKGANPLREGASVVLHFHPADAPPMDVSAVVWRVDPDGLVFFFVGALE